MKLRNLFPFTLLISLGVHLTACFLVLGKRNTITPHHMIEPLLIRLERPNTQAKKKIKGRKTKKVSTIRRKIKPQARPYLIQKKISKKAIKMRYFKGPLYPKIALKRSWEGEVHLEIFYNNEGVVDKVNILESSGYVPLDKAASKAAYEWLFDKSKFAKNRYTKRIQFKLK